MRRVILGTLLWLVVSAALLTQWVVRATPQVRGRVTEALSERFASAVELADLEASLAPRPRVSGTGLAIRHRGRTDVPPLITIARFDASAGVFGLVRPPLHLRTVDISGLTIVVPPGGLASRDKPDDDTHAPHAATPSPILIDRLRSNGARLEMLSGKPGRLPRIFEIHALEMRHFGDPAGARFEASLTNPVPKGPIETSGVFGPWHADEPGLTPVQGEYVFREADLDAIRGLGGRLTSQGIYRGVLQRIEVEGQTDTPDFSLDVAGQPVPLRTRFQAVVDGTSGDTLLEQVEATLRDTLIVARGALLRAEDVHGRRLALDVEVDGGRLEDLLTLAVKGAQPPLTGRIDLQTRLVLPAGDADVVDKLQLEGAFHLAQARFTNLNVQRRIVTLSRRGRGEESDEGAEHERVVSNLQGRFQLRDGRLTLRQLTFAVPGSVVVLNGVYDLRRETLAFTGDLLTEASLADMTSGVKSLFARLAQPFFRRPGGGTKVPITITGTRSQPSFGLDFGRVL